MNRLEHETSPYLRQHADNPVDWYPWGEEAFARARAEDKPILLSVGYSSCHWCHVMAHESFEDDAVAAVMNERFVNVKVDREERPDVDAIYMQAVQAMTGSGGWPMTVFLDPAGRPFFGGTYFPPDDRQGMPGFVRLLDAIDDAWHHRRADLDQQAEQLRAAIEESTAVGSRGPGGALSSAILEQAVTNLRDQFDGRFGGFGRAPKFPQAMTLTFLLDQAAVDPSPEILQMVTVSLDAMAAGGIYDQVGGGFHRYSVDAHWLVPHFEKMLYDQALLVRAYLHAWVVTGVERYRRVVEETIGYVLRDLRHADGGFFSAEDADSEGVEGRFYVWSLEELEALCGDALPDVVRYFGVTARGNFEDPHTGFRGNILHAVGPADDRPESFARVLPALFAAREQRVRPGLDDKVLLGWNALFLRSLAEAADVLGRDDWMEAARTNARFLLRELRRDDGRLLRSWQEGRANHLAYAEDYAAMLEALLTLAELDEVAWLAEARTVADELVRLFADDDRGGFFTTGVDAEALIVRPKDSQDNATPSENSLAADGLLRLAALTGDADAAARGERWVATLAPVLGEYPTAFAFLLEALARVVRPPLEVAVVGSAGDPGRDALVDVLRTRLLPAAVRVAAEPGAGTELTPLLAERGTVDGLAAAYVCERFACRLPVTDPEELRAQLDAVAAFAPISAVVARLVYSAITSLDGCIEDPSGRFDWAEPDEEVHAFVNDQERAIGTYLYGRRMYETMVAWETMDTGPGQSPVVRDYTAIWQAADKVVYSTTLDAVASARTRIEPAFDLDAVRRMKETADRDLGVGGPELAADAIRAGLVDELHLFVAPVIVGGGKRALPDDVRLDLELVDERRFARGFVHLHHRVRR